MRRPYDRCARTAVVLFAAVLAACPSQPPEEQRPAPPSIDAEMAPPSAAADPEVTTGSPASTPETGGSTGDPNATTGGTPLGGGAWQYGGDRTTAGGVTDTATRPGGNAGPGVTDTATQQRRSPTGAGAAATAKAWSGTPSKKAAAVRRPPPR